MINWFISNDEIWHDYKNEMNKKDLLILKERLEKEIKKDKQILKELEQML